MRARTVLRLALAVVLPAVAPTIARAQSAPDLPREHVAYAALDALDTAGCLDSRLSTSRALSRTEVARLLLEAADALDPDGGFDALQRRVDLLLDELHVEADVLLGGEPDLAQAYWKPIDHFGWQWSRRGGPRPPDGRQGRVIVEGSQTFAWFETHGAFGPVSFALDPEVRHYPDDFGPAADEQDTRLRLVRGYVRATLLGMDLTYGRLTPDWGPGRPRGGDGLFFSANAAGFVGASLRTSEPVLLPWVFSALGPIGWEVFTGQLEKGRPIPKALIGGFRFMWRPWPFFEASIARGFMFGGTDRPLNPGLMLTGLHDNRDGPTDRDLSNQIAGGDLRLRLPLPGGAGCSIYGEFFGEDEAGGLPSKWSHRVGVHVAGLPPWRGVELRLEYSQLHRAAYQHGTYQGGWNYYDVPLGHHVGPGASEVSGEIVCTPWWPAGWGLIEVQAWGSAEIRRRRHRPGFPGEEHRQFGGRLSWWSSEGVRLSLDAWWLRIYRFGGVHGITKDGGFVGLSAEVRF